MATPSSYMPFFVTMSSVFMLMGLTNADFNVLSYGAKADGATDSTKPFLKAWAAACGSTKSATIYVPKGRFLLKAVEFRGPCKSRITVRVDGTLVAPSDYRALGNSGYWILFIQVNKITFLGGNLDARAAKFWACRSSGQSCPPGARVSYSFTKPVIDNFQPIELIPKPTLIINREDSYHLSRPSIAASRTIHR